jgi:Uma2 family endonuclease
MANAVENLGIDPELLMAWLAVPEHMTAEIVGGELITMPRPAPKHAFALGRLTIATERKGRRGDGGGWIILPEPAVMFRADLLSPDLAGWRVERMPALPEEARIELAPDWVCEILSPSTQGTDRARKMPTYAACGVPHAWLLDPIARYLEVYRLADGRWLQLGVWRDDASVCAEPFEDLEIRLADLWNA